MAQAAHNRAGSSRPKWIRRQFDKICDESGFRTLPKADAEIQSLELASTSQKPEDLGKALTCPLVPRILCSSNSLVDQETSSVCCRSLVPKDWSAEAIRYRVFTDE
jgi:hypothetical protein